MMKRLLTGGLIAAALAGLPGLSLAGDIANIQPIGFSADGKVFGFQEFGIEEGGAPYSNTYFVDTDSGQYLEGTPFHTEMNDKDANLSKARRQNLTAARSQMDKYDLLTNPGLIAAFNPPTELGSPSKTIRYTTLATDGPPKSPYTLSLGEVPVPAPKDCAASDKRVLGFSL
jgi:predicted secreted protein